VTRTTTVRRPSSLSREMNISAAGAAGQRSMKDIALANADRLKSETTTYVCVLFWCKGAMGCASILVEVVQRFLTTPPRGVISTFDLKYTLGLLRPDVLCDSGGYCRSILTTHASIGGTVLTQ